MRLLSELVGISWFIFWVYWFIEAIRSKGEIRTKRHIHTWSSLFIFAVIVLTSVLADISHVKLDYIVADHYFLLGVIGALFVYAGLGLAIWARRCLGKNWALPMAVKSDARLVTTGPYKYVRHPIYSGFLLALLGTGLVEAISWLFVLLFAAVYFTYSAIQEDKSLEAQFSKKYLAYKSRTKFLIPYIF